MRNSNQVLHGDQTRREANFHRVDNAPDPAKIFLKRILTCDLFAAANLLVHSQHVSLTS